MNKKPRTPKHAVGGPATVSGVDFEIDCAACDAISIIERYLANPLENGFIKLQPRAGDIAGRLTAWDHSAGGDCVVEAKQEATQADLTEWLARATAAIPGVSPSTHFHLVYSRTSAATTTLKRLLDLAGSADSIHQLRVLALNDAVTIPPALATSSPETIRRLELRLRDASGLREVLIARLRAVVETDPAQALDVLRATLRDLAKGRRRAHASELVAALANKAITFRNLFTQVAYGTPREQALFVVSAFGRPCPFGLVAAVVGGEQPARDHLGALQEADLVTGAPQDYWSSRLLTQIAPSNAQDILRRVLGEAAAALDRNEAWATAPPALESIAEFFVTNAGAAPDVVATSFHVFDKKLKNIGNIRLVLRVAEAVLAAARRAPRTEAVRKGEAQALICGIAWSKQRIGLLEEALADGNRSKEIGIGLGWARNTAFCEKCLGRLLRLTAVVSPLSTSEKARRLERSVRELRQAIQDFASVGDMSAIEKEKEIGATYSLLGRTYVEYRDQTAARDAIDEATKRLTDEGSKDYADLWILRGDYELVWGTPDGAHAAFSVAIRATTGSGYETAEMRGRAFEQRAQVADAKAAEGDRAEARRIYTALGDDESAARVELGRLRANGALARQIEEVIKHESAVVGLEVVRLARTHLGAAADAIAHRATVPKTAIPGWLAEAKRNTTIRDSSSTHRVAPNVVKTSRAAKLVSLQIALTSIFGNSIDASDAAEALAAELLRSHNQRPVDVQRIARDLGVTEIAIDETVTSGCLVRGAGPYGAYRIVIGPHDGLARTRFTIAHELGHLVLVTRFADRPIVDGPELEHFCDAFAGALLLPSPEIEATESTLARVLEFAHKYAVSVPATARRFRQLRRDFHALAVSGGDITWAAGAHGKRKRVAELSGELHDVVVSVAAHGRPAPERIFTLDRLWVLEVLRRPHETVFFLTKPKDNQR